MGLLTLNANQVRSIGSSRTCLIAMFDSYVTAICSGCVICCGSACALVTARRNLMSLRWPKTLSYGALRRRVMSYMRLHGWMVGNTVGPELMFHKNNNHITVRFWPSERNVTDLTQRFATDANRPWWNERPKYWAAVILCASAVPPRVMIEGSKQKAYILHYKALDRIVNLEKVSTEALQSIVQSLSEGGGDGN